MKIPKKRELQLIAFNHLSDIDSQDLMNISIKLKRDPFLKLKQNIILNF